jgi:hypothetical protein
VQGWCPPIPILRRLAFRTTYEIEEERQALKGYSRRLRDCVAWPRQIAGRIGSRRSITRAPVPRLTQRRFYRAGSMSADLSNLHSIIARPGGQSPRDGWTAYSPIESSDPRSIE